MSGYWRTNKQKERYENGRSLTERINYYVNLWENRCYSNGIPDEAPNKLIHSGRVPTYKAIAIAILKNDIRLTTLGFHVEESGLVRYLREKRKREIDGKETGQIELL